MKVAQLKRIIPELFLQEVPFGMTMLGGRKNRHYRRSLARNCGISIQAPQRQKFRGIFTESSTEIKPLNFPWNLHRNKTVELSVEFSRKVPQRLNRGTFCGIFRCGFSGWTTSFHWTYPILPLPSKCPGCTTSNKLLPQQSRM